MKVSNWNIRPAIPSDLEEILEIYKACTLKMNAAGLHNWHSSYPDKQTIMNDILEAALYLIETDKIHGAVTLNDDQPPEYKDIKWEYHREPYLVVHRLAVSPEQQGKGYAIHLMRFAEEFARSKNCPSIRMDVYTINAPGRELYRKLKYKELNEFYFPGYETPFIGLEKKMI